MTTDTSHDLAHNMKAFADFLLSRPAFGLPYNALVLKCISFYSGDKDKFLSAAKSLGTGKKEFTSEEVRFTVTGEWGEFTIKAPRSTVCRLIKPAEYDCDPFLSPDEEKSLGGAA